MESNHDKRGAEMKTKRYDQKGNSVRHKRLYMTWRTMINRCYVGTADNYEYYGAKGIGVIKEWRDDFNNFLHWSLSNGYQKEFTIDRIQTDKNYSPDNCRWVDSFVQAQNRGMDGRNKSGVKGVSIYKYGYRAYITRNYKRKYLGCFKTLEEAKEAMAIAEKQYEDGVLVI